MVWSLKGGRGKAGLLGLSGRITSGGTFFAASLRRPDLKASDPNPGSGLFWGLVDLRPERKVKKKIPNKIMIHGFKLKTVIQTGL